MIEADLTEGAPQKRVRVIIEDKAVQRVWCAAECLKRLLGTEWLHIDQIGKFLKDRQREAEAVGFDLRHPSSMYALELDSWTRDEKIAETLRAALAPKSRLLDLEMRDGQAWFRPVPYAEHDVYTVPATLAAALTWSPEWIASPPV